MNRRSRSEGAASVDRGQVLVLMGLKWFNHFGAPVAASRSMNLLRALRSLRRRHLIVPAAVAAIVLTASVPAWADEVWPALVGLGDQLGVRPATSR